MTVQARTSRLPARADVKPFLAMDVLARANALASEGRDVRFMCVGQPFAPAPSAARSAAMRMIDAGRVGYTDAAGRSDLRSRIARHYADVHGVDLDPARVFVTTGSSAGFMLAFLGLFEPGAKVAMAAPGYPAYRNILSALSLVPVEVPVVETSRWVLDVKTLADAYAREAFDGVLLASPGNPTGTMTAPETLRDVLGWCDERGVEVVSDEIYHRLTYEDAPKEATALQFTDRAVVVNSFSKFYCMTGWRVGWLVLPERLTRATERLGQNLYISAPEVSQVAALHALDATDELEAVRKGYANNRSLLLERLPRMGFGTTLPIDGAFYAYADVSHFTDDSLAFCRGLLDATGVAITPGVDFDLERGHEFVRISFAGSADDVSTACERMGQWLEVR